MRKEKVETVVDSFVDKEGRKRYFVIAAVSEVFPTKDEQLGEISHELVRYDEYDSESIQVLVKGLKLGWAFCNPNDKFNENLGITIATGRARKNKDYEWVSSNYGSINTATVKALLNEKVRWFKEDPENRIIEYSRKK